MLITESQMNHGYSNNLLESGLNLLNNLSYIEENVNPHTVPVLESNNRGRYIVDLDSLINFSESIGTNDLGYCLDIICEANQIDERDVSFSIQEERVIEEDSIASLCEEMLNRGMKVYAKPMSENCNTSVVLNFLEDLAFSTNFSTLPILESFLFLETLTPEAADQISKLIKSDDPEIIKYRKGLVALRSAIIRNKSQFTNIDTNWALEQARKFMDTPGYILSSSEGNKSTSGFSKRVNDSPAGGVPYRKPSQTNDEEEEDDDLDDEAYGTALNSKSHDTTRDALNTIHKFQYEGMNYPRKKLSQILAWLYRKSSEFNNKLHAKGVEQGKIPWYKKILSMITRAIETVSRKLHNAVSNKDNQYSEIKRDWNFKKEDNKAS